MRVFVYEYLSAGQPGAESLRREGRAMRDAALADLGMCRGVEAVAMPEAPGDEEAVFREVARGCDAALVIAPEFDDLLAQRAEWALEEGCRLLGPSPVGIRLTADKLRLAAWWRNAGVPTPPALHYTAGECPFPYPVVVKPRFGAGALRTFRVRHPWQYVRAGGPGAIVQPELPGGERESASVSFLLGPGQRVPLAPAAQAIRVRDDEYSYEGGRLPLPLPPAALDLAARAVACVPGLEGYVGVDLVLGDDPCVIEINPRLTTSYIGLRQLARFNVMQAMLDILDGRSPGVLDYHPGEVTFHTDEPGD